MNNRGLYHIAGLALLLLVICNPSIKNPGPDRIKVVYCNAQGLIHMNSIGGNCPIFQTKKLLDLQAFLYTHEPDIVVINETWLNSYIGNNEIVSDSLYTIFRKDRSEIDKQKYGKIGGGGVMILCKNNSDVQYSTITEQTDLPIISILVKPKKGPKLCFSTYYRYDYSDHESNSEAERYYQVLSKRYNSLTIIGDLNLSSIKNWDLPSSNVGRHSSFLEIVSNLGMISLINSPTHRSGNILDLILTNRPSIYSKVKIEQDLLVNSDHSTIKCTINLGVSKKNTTKFRKFSYKKANWVRINQDLNSIDWNALFAHLNARDCVSCLKSKLDIILKKYVPMVTVKPSSRPPWFDDDLKVLRKSVERARKLHLKHPDDISLNEEYKILTDNYKQSVADKRASYYTDEETNDSNTITKKFYKYLKSLVGSTRIPDYVSYNDNSSCRTSDKCNMFNNFFCAQFSDISNYNTVIDSDRNHVNDCNDLIFSEEDVRKILKDINPSKATGPDNIDGIVLKKCSSVLARPLAYIFNLSYHSSYLPSEWKEANVVPVHKKGDKSLVKNYRPISLTCLVMKVFERLIRDKLFLICQDKISPHQHGFVPNKSCCTQMIEFTDSIAYNINNHLQTDIVYFDFAKAFDSVNHDVIIDKLRNQYNINGKMLRFIVEYLRDRKQRVVIDSISSEWAPVYSGVPQGSILGPLLFVLFINDITNVINQGTNSRLYADDLKIWKSVHSLTDSLQSDIDNLHNWSIENRISFHPAKCKLIRLNLNRREIAHSYTLAGQEIVCASSEKDLGVLISNRLNFEEHRDSILASQRQKLGLLKRHSKLARTPPERKTLYLSLVRSLLEHCSQIWRPTSTTGLEKFEKIQKRAIKWILDEENSSYSELEYFSKLTNLNIPPIHNKFQLNDLLLLHKIIYGISPINLPPYLSFFDPSQIKINTRLQSNMDPLHLVSSESHRVDIFKNSFFYRAHNLWNLLPQPLRATSDPIIFSSQLKRHLWDISGSDQGVT